MVEDLASAARLSHRLRAVLFADVVDSVSLIQKDPQGTIGRWRDYAAAVAREEVARAGGRIVKSTGDGMLVEFGSAVDAVDAALLMQARIERGNLGVAQDLQIHLRMGIHFADVMADEIDLYDDGVNLPARLMALGGAQEIIVSAAVRDELTDGLGVTIEDLGERKLKGIERPARAFRAWPQGPTPARSPDRARHAGDRPSTAAVLTLSTRHRTPPPPARQATLAASLRRPVRASQRGNDKMPAPRLKVNMDHGYGAAAAAFALAAAFGSPIVWSTRTSVH